MEFGDREALGRFVREHHVHYEVEPEEVIEAGKRDLVGLRLRIFATHEKTRMAVPGCPVCVKLELELQSFAEHVVRAGEQAKRTEIVPARRALFQSSEAPDADEVAVVVRVRCDSPRGGEDRCLGEIRDRLAQAGVPRR
jgi:hypothetical protein